LRHDIALDRQQRQWPFNTVQIKTREGSPEIAINSNFGCICYRFRDIDA